MSARMDRNRRHVHIYTDGGCDPNPGPGGWAYLLVDIKSGREREAFGGDPDTTNNRMELTAVIEALKALEAPSVVDLFTDSEYVRLGMTRWIRDWVERGWQRDKGQPILNLELWQALHALAQAHKVNWHWVKGHAGDPNNERVDRLARAAIPRPARRADPDATHVILRIAGPPGGVTRGAFGWAAQVVRGDRVAHLQGGHPAITANHFSLRAALAVMAHVAPGERVRFFTNNSYLHDGITRWVPGWRKSGWIKKGDGKPVRFREEWEALDRLSRERDVEWVRFRDDDAPAQFAALEAAARRARDMVKR